MAHQRVSPHAGITYQILADANTACYTGLTSLHPKDTGQKNVTQDKARRCFALTYQQVCTNHTESSVVMADIFVSYAREDKPRITALIKELEQQGWSVWWDAQTTPGRTFLQVIEEELSSAKCVVVAWSKQSVVSEWVKSEAIVGFNRKCLVPVLMDEVDIPLPFNLIHAANLADWEGESNKLELSKIFSAVNEIVRGKPPKKIRKSKRKAVKRITRRTSKEVTPGESMDASPTTSNRDNSEGQPLEKRILAILRSYKSGAILDLFIDEHLFVEPDIPGDKLMNAMQRCQIPSNERILGLVDLTFFGSAKNCLIFGIGGIYFHSKLSLFGWGQGAISYDDFEVRFFCVSSWSKRKVILGKGQYIYTSSHPIQHKIVEILEAIKEIIVSQLRQSATAS